MTHVTGVYISEDIGWHRVGLLWLVPTSLPERVHVFSMLLLLCSDVTRVGSSFWLCTIPSHSAVITISYKSLLYQLSLVNAVCIRSETSREDLASFSVFCCDAAGNSSDCFSTKTRRSFATGPTTSSDDRPAHVTIVQCFSCRWDGISDEFVFVKWRQYEEMLT